MVSCPYVSDPACGYVHREGSCRKCLMPQSDPCCPPWARYAPIDQHRSAGLTEAPPQNSLDPLCQSLSGLHPASVVHVSRHTIQNATLELRFAHILLASVRLNAPSAKQYRVLRKCPYLFTAAMCAVLGTWSGSWGGHHASVGGP
jgi:hypothetical protein